MLAEHGYVDHLAVADARDTLAVLEALPDALPLLADLVVNCVNVGGTEFASILCCKDGGTVYFFSMSTSFTAAALGAEGVGKDVNMMVGNGYAKGHAAVALQTLARSSADQGLLRRALRRGRPGDTIATAPSNHRRPALLEHRNLRGGEFWRTIPAYEKIDEKTFLDHIWQGRK